MKNGLQIGQSLNTSSGTISLPGNTSTKSSQVLGVGQSKFQYPRDNSPKQPHQQVQSAGHASMTSSQVGGGHQAQRGFHQVPQQERQKLGIHLNISNSMSPQAYNRAGGVYQTNQPAGSANPHSTKNSTSIQLANQFHQNFAAGPGSPTNQYTNNMSQPLTSPYSHGLAQKQQ